MHRPTFAPLGLVMLLAGAVAAPSRAQDRLNGHLVKLDSQGKLVSWVEPQSRAYDRVMRLAWDFLLHTAPTESNGQKAYLAYCCLDSKSLQATDWPHNPAGLYGMFADSAVAYYAYSGDGAVVRLAESMLDYQLAHGTTPADWNWARVPYASSDAGATNYTGSDEAHYCGIAKDKEIFCGRGDGRFVIEPDKVGELGIGYLEFYELSGEAKYRDAAIACADALAAHVRPGDVLGSPWPFRANARTGKPREEYSSNVIGPIRLFDELVRLNLGRVEEYRQARAQAWQWMMKYPMANNNWAGYFEDVNSETEPVNFNQYSAMETARYLLKHPEMDRDWRQHVAGLIAWVEKAFVVDFPNEPAVQWGANAVSEQLWDHNKMGDHTARYASVNALWYEKTGDAAAKEKAFRSFNWATYMCRENGVVVVGPVDQSIWWSDGYGDYLRQFTAGLGAVPDWAPDGENHLLRSSSIVRHVAYQPAAIEYTTFDADATEVLRVGFTPDHVTANGKPLARRSETGTAGWTFDQRSGVLRLRHTNAREVRVEGKK